MSETANTATTTTTTTKAQENTAKIQAEDSLKLTDQYIALLIMVFDKAGLIEVYFFCSRCNRYLTEIADYRL